MTNLSQHGYSHEQVLSLIYKAHGTGRMRYRVDILRSGIPVFQAAYDRCSIACDGESEVKHTGRITLLDDPGINWESDLFRPVMYLEHAGLTFEFPFVPLKPVTVKRTLTSQGGFREAELFDESVDIQENSLGEVLYFPAGTLYTTAVRTLLERADISRVSITPSTHAMASEREDWEESDYILTVANSLLEEIGYTALAVNYDGTFESGPYVQPGIEQAKIHYEADENSLVFLEKETEIDSYKRANRFIGVAFSPDMEAPLRWEYLNSDPASPSSTVRQGRIRTAVLEYNNVADMDTLRLNVMRHAMETARAYERTTLSTAIMPHHGVLEVITVNAKDAQGIYEEVGWSVDHFGASGKMTHRLRRLIYE